MGLEIKTEQIGRYAYHIEKLGARESGRVFFRLCNMFAPVLDGLDVKAIKTGKDVKAQALAGLARALHTAKAEDFEYLCDAFAKKSRIDMNGDGTKMPLVSQQFETHFAGEFG